MLDPLALADLGRAAQTLALPLALWTVVALVAEAGLRLGRASAALGLPVRGALLAALPVSVAVPAALSALAPTAVIRAVTEATPMQWLPEVAVGAPPPTVAGPSLDVAGVALGVVALTASAVAVWQIVRLARALVGVRATRRALAPAGPGATAAVARAQTTLNVGRPVAAAATPAGVAPFTVGWRRPVVALPDGLSDDAREVAALHEVAHVRRADFAWHAAQRAVQAVFAAHPLVWVLGRGLDLDRERAADALVLDARPDQRRTYADLLLSYAALPAPALALGAAPGTSTLKSRIDAMTSPLSATRTRRLVRTGRLTGLVALALVAGLAATTAPTPFTDDDPFRLVNPVTTVNGQPVEGGLSLATANPLGAFFVDIAEYGRFVVALRPFDGATRSGMVSGSTILAEASGRTVRIEASEPILTRGGRPVYVRFDPADRRRIGGPLRMLRSGLINDAANLGPVGQAPSYGASRAAADTTDVYEMVDEMPQIIGGLESVMQRVEYPELQRRAGVEGRSVVQFIVTEAGEVADAVVVRSSGDDGLDRAALAALDGVRFTPGREDGRAVRVRFAIPITFRLPEGDGAGPSDPSPRTRMDEDGVYGVVDDQPELIGGLSGLMDRVVYPQVARDAGIEGAVIVQFVVDEEGRVEDARAVRSPDETLSQAALEAVRASRFQPGRVDGTPVRVRFAVPITFRLPEGEGQDRGERPDRGDYRMDGSLRARPAGERPARDRLGYRMDGNRTDRPASETPARDRTGYRLDGSRVAGTVRYAGVDVSRLTPGSRQAFENTLRGLPDILGRRNAESGDIEVRYTVGADGRNDGPEYVSGDRSLLPLAAFLVGTLEAAEDARPGPGGSWTGMFRLWYIEEG